MELLSSEKTLHVQKQMVVARREVRTVGGGDPSYPNEIAAVGLLFAEPYADGRCRGEEPPRS